MSNLTSRRWVLALVLVALAAGACGGSTGGTPPPAASAPTATKGSGLVAITATATPASLSQVEALASQLL